METYIVIRKCCTNGNCDQCMYFPRDKNRKKIQPLVCQFITTHKPMAEKVEKNWHEYDAYIASAIEVNIQLLTPTSAEWVREKLKNPERINNRLI